MPNYLSSYPALQVQTPSFTQPLNNFRTGIADAQAMQQRNLLKEVGGMAAQGNMLGAANAAYAGGDVKTGSVFSQMDRETKLKSIDIVSRGLDSVTNQGELDQLTGTVESIFGPGSVPNDLKDISKVPVLKSILAQGKKQIIQGGTGEPGGVQNYAIDLNAGDVNASAQPIGLPRLPATPAPTIVYGGGGVPGSTQPFAIDRSNLAATPIGLPKLPAPSTAGPSPYKLVDPTHPELGQTFVPGGPADPTVQSTLAGAKTTGAISAVAESPEAIGIAGAIQSGKQPPDLKGLGQRMQPAVRSVLAKDGYDLSSAQIDWKKAERLVTTLNSQRLTQYTSLAGSVTTTIDYANGLASKLANVGVTAFNEAKLRAMVNLEGNSEKGILASQYIAAVNTVREEFANLVNGGYAPTDAAWTLANQQIRRDYGDKQFKASMDTIKKLVNFRLNAISYIHELGPLSPNRYIGPSPGKPLGTTPDGTTIIPPGNPDAVNPYSDIRGTPLPPTGTTSSGVPFTVN